MRTSPALLESTLEPAPEVAPAPVLLVDLPAWHTVFLQNLSDLLRPRPQTPFKSSSRPGSFWPDVFVTSRLPWNRFGLSLICHLAAIVVLWGSVQLWPQRPQVVVSRTFNRADVIYYAPAEFLPPLDTGGARKPRPQKGEPEHAPQPIISVPPESDNRSQTIVTPSDVKLNHDVPLPNIVAWSQTARPVVPLASTSAAASRSLPSMSASVVAPAPETMPANGQQAPTLSQAVVAPAPEVDAASARKLGELNIGHSEVVAPAPVLPVAEQYTGNAGSQPALGNGGPTVVAPPPSIQGNAGSDNGGRLIALGIHPAAAREPMDMPAGNRRGTFAATPAGKAGAAGTPDISANTERGSGSGSNPGKGDGIPTGLTVGVAPNSQNTSTVADAIPPRVAAPPAHSAPAAVGEDKATDVDHWIFGDRKFYKMTLNMPNLNSAGGSWVIRFAELNGTEGKNEDKSENKGELTAPVATQKVDPAYPLEMMRRNVQGTVTLYAVIRNDGSVTDVRVLRGVDGQLDQYARAALAHWRFRPATKNGNAVDLEAVVLIPFKPVRGKSSF